MPLESRTTLCPYECKQHAHVRLFYAHTYKEIAPHPRIKPYDIIRGLGILPDVLPRIFDLSYSTAAHEKENSGLGLAFVKIMLDLSGTKTACHSRAGKNSFTSFAMTFSKA